MLSYFHFYSYLSSSTADSRGVMVNGNLSSNPEQDRLYFT